jgi:hypothetical protein
VNRPGSIVRVRNKSIEPGDFRFRIDSAPSSSPSTGSQRAQHEAERATYAATIAKIEALIPILQERVHIQKISDGRETGSKVIYLENLSQLVEQQKELGVQQSHV